MAEQTEAVSLCVRYHVRRQAGLCTCTSIRDSRISRQAALPNENQLCRNDFLLRGRDLQGDEYQTSRGDVADEVTL